MAYLALFLFLVAVVLGLLCWGFDAQLERRDEEIVQLRRQFDRYLSDDGRLLDTLWNRAQIETARAERAGRKS
jgi:hypothetical protein